MRLHLDPSHKGLHEFVKKLPTLFERGEGTVLHAGRNTIRLLAQEGELLAAKRFRQPGALQGILYAHIRRSKARRSFEHAVRLISLGIGTPQPVAWSEYRRKGRLTDSFYVSRYSDLKPLSEFAARFPDTASRPVLDAFARFVAELHEKGIDHRDFNQGNILCGYSPEKEQWRFELIDINRMRFLDRPLTPRQCMINLRRLSCPAPAFLLHPGPLCRSPRLEYRRHAAAQHLLPPGIRSATGPQETLPAQKKTCIRLKIGRRVWIIKIFHYICPRLRQHMSCVYTALHPIFISFSFTAREKAGSHAHKRM